ncbi:helix-turn-helix domain-containing protein [Parerythrobacter aestuarii]|uniref:helix-turn-helix domain-containing protein n=1 Tax=Parerythrobacter aestuarii TaxID=3020909 RepID=UPI0024DEE446|nr:helix-turn-helix domain-containing protein [Parerythrobacter aestuarii]
MILITEGGGTIRYESELIEFRAPRLLLVPARVVHGFDWLANSDGMVMTIADVHLLQLVARYPEFQTLFDEPRSIRLAPADCAEMAEVMGSMLEELSWAGVGQSAAVEAALLMVLVHATRQVHHLTQQEPQSMRQLGLVARYRQLIEQRFRLREPIEAYARELAVSVTTLREACAAAGHTPTEIRDQRAILEAQRLLAYSAETIAEIGEAIGIPDPAYFSRFFSRKCGQSPDSWRRSLRHSKQQAA